jgi:AraC-like DNA-binding protein
MTQKKYFKPYLIDAIVSAKKEIEKEFVQDTFPSKNITELANEVGIGRNSLQTGFKQLYGITTKEYALQLRMEKAKKMLEEGKKTIKQIASDCGYRSQGNFTSAFRKINNVSPSQYQQQYIDNNFETEDIKSVLHA